MNTVEIKDKYLLTVKEASDYFGIGESKLRQLTEGSDNPFVFWNGTKRLIKRKEMEKYISDEYSI